MKYALLRSALIFFFALLLHFSYAQQCEFRLVMRDSFGDGWNGGILTLIIDGTPQSLFLATDASDSTMVFPLNTGSSVQLAWSPGPIYNEEVSFEWYNNDGDTLFYVKDPAGGVLYNKMETCVACLKPDNVQIENVYDTRAKIRWAPASGISNPVGWWVVYDTTGFTPGPGVGDTLYVFTPKATITGLTKKTFYDFYVQQDCGNGESSSLAGPYTFETYRSDDVGITAVRTPQNACDLGTETVTIAMTNFGANPQSLIPFNYTVNGIPAGVPQPEDGFYTGVIGKDSTTVIEFETKSDFSDPGEYVIVVWTEMKGDEFTANDTFTFRILNRLVTPYQQNFENWAGGWSVDTANSTSPSWQFGTPQGTTINQAASGKNAWVTNLSGAYNDEEFSYLNSPCFDFSDLTEDPVIEFSLNYSTETDYDGGYLEMSTDDGASWQKVGAIGEGLNWYTFDNTSLNLGDIWNGESNGWVNARHRLPAAAGKFPVYLRFVFAADELLQLEGMGIDDIRIFEPLPNDLAGLAVTTTADADDCGLEQDEVTFEFTNFGSEPQSGFEVYYSIDGTAPVVENVGPSFTAQPDQTVSYTFTTPFDSRDGLFTIKCWTGLTNEGAPANDTATHIVNHLPDPVPLHEDFEAGLPANWITNGTVTNGHNNSSRVLAYRMNTSNKTYNAEAPRVGFVSPGDSLSFDYRIVNFSGAGTVPTTLGNNTKFEVQISTDCGQVFQTAYTIDAVTHTPSTALKTVAIDLAPYAGFSVLTRFKGTWGFGDFYFDLDNVNLRACATDMQLSAETVPADPGQSNGTAKVNVGLGNPPYRYLWSTGDTTQTVTGLATSAVTVTVTDDLGCTGVLTVNIGNSPVFELDGLTRLALQPNPTSGASTLLADFERAATVQAQVMDITGRLIWLSAPIYTDRFSASIELGNMPDGLYLVRLTADGRSVVRKLVKGR